MDVNYLHLTKLPESKKFSHIDKAFINPVQSTFSVKKIVESNDGKLIRNFLRVNNQDVNLGLIKERKYDGPIEEIEKIQKNK